MATIEINQCSFSLGNKNIIHNLTCSIKRGSRCLLVGGNGAGKTTLLRLLAGKHICKGITVFGRDVYYDTTLNFSRSFLHQNWGLRTVSFAGQNIPYVADIMVKDMMKDLQNEYLERRNELIELLDINLEWRMHLLSDGQRRRVQIFLGLLRPVELILLDEITNVLDILCREKLMTWLLNESIKHKTTIIQSTHIFDGLDDWYTDVICLRCNNTHSSLQYFGPKQSKTIYSQVKDWLILDNVKESSDDFNKSNVLTQSTNSAGGFAPGRFYNYW